MITTPMFAILNNKGEIKLLNDTYPCLYTSKKAAEDDNVFGQKIICVHPEEFDLEHCAIDHCWPAVAEVEEQ